ncbi:MAG: hypothetical protein IT425_02785 [Pirellulales bacterium]|nr:hypothetical protein [Pirellulales bacterium]
MNNSRDLSDRRIAGLLGFAFDADDGLKRITRGKHFLLAGGSEETHGLMQETIIRVNDRLDSRGLVLTDISPEQLFELLQDIRG